MSEKKDITIGFKLSESERITAEKIAEKYGHKPGSLAGMLLRHFVIAHKKHGSKIKFPPEFDYYENSSFVDQKEEIANASSKRKAG